MLLSAFFPNAVLAHAGLEPMAVQRFFSKRSLEIGRSDCGSRTHFRCQRGVVAVLSCESDDTSVPPLLWVVLCTHVGLEGGLIAI
jgi:hypothetical protein